jgi:triosephosphate isomerase
MRRTFICGNWKMNKTASEAAAWLRELRGAVSMVRDRVEIAVAPTHVALSAACKALEDSNVVVAAQNCHFEASGAFTGEVSADMLKDLGATYVIVGHSERRQLFTETDESVNRKVHAVLKAGLGPILCVGETLAEREAGKTLDVISRQVRAGIQGVSKEQGSKCVLAYEPVWAIGTGKNASARQAQEVHAHIRGLLNEAFGAEVANQIRIQYGGSVKPDNAAELLSQPDIDGALVGGASLKVADFAAIVKAKGT